MATEVDETRLDDQAALAELDPQGMLQAVASAGAQVRRASAAADDAGIARLAEEGRPRSLVVTGMGGSGIAGDALAAVAGPGAPVPFLTHRGYVLPGWLGPLDLVMAVSFSGSTEETLACADEAVRRGCRLLAVAPVGSPLADIVARGHGVWVPVEHSGRQPRASLWELAVPLMVAADRLGLASVSSAVLDETADRLDELAERLGPAIGGVENPAKGLAVDLAGSLPMVWGTSELAGAAAYRFSCQLAENACAPALWGVLPEAGHNQVVTLGGPWAGSFGEEDFFRDRVSEPAASPGLRLVLFRDAEEHPQVARRREATVELAERDGVPVSEVAAEDGHRLSRLAYLVALGDFASVYLALALGVDPTPVAPITEIKERIST